MAKQTKAKTRQTAKRSSMFFMLWAAFTLVSLAIVLLLGITQGVQMHNTFDREARRLLTEKGSRINREIRQEIPEVFQNNYDAYVRYLSLENGVQVYILNDDGSTLFPSETGGNFGNYNETFDFTDDIVELKEQLKEVDATWENQKFVLYSTEVGYVYGSTLPSYGNSAKNTYLYVLHSVELTEMVVSQMTARLIWLALFVFIFAFAVSSALSGLLARPIDEMTKKAKLLAKGDFSVDFTGNNYTSETELLAQTLNFARDEISKADRMQKELIANISHDFKTPLTMIKAYAEMIVEFENDSAENRKRNAQVIIEEADRLTSLVSDVLDLSKIRSGLQALKNDLFDISAQLYAIIARFDYLAQRSGYTFEMDVEEGLYTQADQLKIGQVLYNLIGNAVNYTGMDKSVKICLKKLDGRIYFAVTDTGAGIAEEEIVTIWDRYYRSNEMHKRPVQGTGLGLAIVKTILERHGFAFGVQSKIGEGSTFYAYFPLMGEVSSEEDDFA